MFIYQKTAQYFAQIAAGFESITVEELAKLGVRHIQPAFRGVYFSADPGLLYLVNYQSRLISHVLAPLASFKCRDRDDLYRGGKTIDWPSLFSCDHTFGIIANVSANESIRHSKFAALCLKDAVADLFRSRFNKRPSVDSSNPDIWINLHIRGNNALVSLDTSGGSLHKRGYRRETVDAPLQETLGAAMIALSKWQGRSTIYDPMCGSGTLLCEAMMKACRIPAGFFRKNFGFFFMPDFRQHLWKSIKKAEDEKIKQLLPNLIAGSDIDRIAVSSAKANCRHLPGGENIHITQNGFENIPQLKNLTIVCNPPYGIRLKNENNLGEFYKKFGDFLKQRCTGSQAFIFFGNRDQIKHIGLKPSWKIPIRNAGLDGRVVKYELF